VTLKIGSRQLFIFDAGTGIKSLASHLMVQNKFPLSAKIFLSHPHWDHVSGLPFFTPFYMKGNEFEIFGANHPNVSLDKIVSDQMDSVYFPVKVKEFSASLKYHPLNEEQFSIGNVLVKTILLTHPGRCLGYRIEIQDRSFCYITDNELYFENSRYYNEFNHKKLLKFISNATLLIIDTTYTDEEYASKINWGHSCVSRVAHLAHEAQVKCLCLFHHDPDQTDKHIDLKLSQAKDILKSLHSKTICKAPREGDSLKL
jgi:phosphoribosyl 1,2-cyclic phosphodiesterase